MNKNDFDVEAFGKVAVLMGGKSAEREISLMSGQCVFDSLLRSGVDAHAIDVKEDLLELLSKQGFDRAFIILHGRYGEDGAIQGVLEMLRIPYTGSGVAASALAMDKVRSKQILGCLNLPVLPTMVFDGMKKPQEIVAQFGLPICVKPVHEGSSNGVSRVNSIDELQVAYEAAKRFKDEVMIEPWIVGREFTVGILDHTALPVLELRVTSGFYDYQAKYFSNETQYFCPVDLPEADQTVLQELSLRAFDALGCFGWARVDFLQDQKGQFWISELNTIPGMTTHSLVPKAAACMGIDFDELVLRILSKTTMLEV